MAVSFKLAGVFSLSLSRMLVAVFVCHAEERLEQHRTGIKEINFSARVNRCFLGWRILMVYMDLNQTDCQDVHVYVGAGDGLC